MRRSDFIALIGQDLVVDYPFFGELQTWNMANFTYDVVMDTIKHNRIVNMNVEVFLKNATNPHKGEATHG